MCNAGLSKKNNTTMTPSKGAATLLSLPMEIISSIFCATVPNQHQYDPSVRQGALNPWLKELRMKKTLPLLCKAIYWPGIDVLYGDITLRRMGQIPALARTLRHAEVRKDIAIRIKSIRLDTCIISLPCADVIRKDLAFILGSTRLHTFSYHPHEAFPSGASSAPPEYCGYFNPTEWLLSASGDPGSGTRSVLTHCLRSGNLLNLDLAMNLDGPLLINLLDLLHSSRTLKTLKLGWVKEPRQSSLKVLSAKPAFCLPELASLQLCRGSEPWFDEYVCSWQLPTLTHLTIILDPLAQPGSILERFGSHLTYLHLYPIGPLYIMSSRWYVPCGLSEGKNILPCIQHLIMPFPHDANGAISSLNLHSPTLTYLDLWEDLDDPEPTVWNKLNTSYPTVSRLLETTSRPKHMRDYREFVSESSRVPMLRTVRALVTYHPVTYLSTARRTRTSYRNIDWPSVCHPALVQDESSVLYYRFPGTLVAQTSRAVLPQEVCDHGRGSLSEDQWPEVYYRCGFVVIDPATGTEHFCGFSSLHDEEKDVGPEDGTSNGGGGEVSPEQGSEIIGEREVREPRRSDHESGSMPVDATDQKDRDGEEASDSEDESDDDDSEYWETDVGSDEDDEDVESMAAMDRDTILRSFARSTEARLWDKL